MNREIPDIGGAADPTSILLKKEGSRWLLFVAMLRSAVSSEWTARLFREFVVTQVLRRVRQHVPMPPAEAPMQTNAAGFMRLLPLRSYPARTCHPEDDDGPLWAPWSRRRVWQPMNCSPW